MILVDSNILLRLASRHDPKYLAARDALSRLFVRGETLAAATQVVAEAWVVSTRPVEQRGGLGFDFDRALRQRRRVERAFTMLPDPPDLYTRWTELLDAHRIVGVNAHEARLVAVMRAHGVRSILTFNGKDFRRYPDIAVIDPASV